MKNRISCQEFFKKVLIVLLTALLFGGGGGIFEKVSLAKAASGEEELIFYFPETGHHLENPFLDFWQTKGGKFIFGLPITEVIEESGMPVQYFQKARLELHPDGQLMLGLLGSELFEEAGFSPSEDLPLPPKFSLFYKKRGGLEIFGYPISPSLEEEGRIVQYFQRARFEYHPEAVDPFYRQKERFYGITLLSLAEVQLTNLGEIAASQKGLPTAAVAQKEKAKNPHSFTPTKKIIVDLTKQELTAFEDETPVLKTEVSTGLVVPGILAGTPKGDFQVLGKYRELTYTGWNPALRIPYEYRRVPFNLHFWPAGARFYLIHGAYWHANFGRPYSLGCVNLDLDFAEQLYLWAEVGTSVKIVSS